MAEILGTSAWWIGMDTFPRAGTGEEGKRKDSEDIDERESVALRLFI